MCRSVKDWGPVWAHSAFAFESGNHELLQAIHCGKGVIQQILRYININHSISLMENHVFENESEIMKKYCLNTSKTRVKKSLKISNITYLGKASEISDLKKIEFKLPSSSVAYIRMIKDGCLYMSSTKINPRSDNSKAQLKDGRFIEIMYFIVDSETKTELTLCKVLNLSQTPLEFKCGELKLLDNTEGDTIIVETKEIKKICVFVDCGIEEKYICPVPNQFYY